MADKQAVTVRIRKLVSNRLLARRQFVVEVTHQARSCATLEELKGIVAKTYEVQDPKTIFLFGFKTHFGGGKTTGFGLIYDTIRQAKKVETQFRLVRNGLATKPHSTRKQRKERRNRAKKVRGAKKAKLMQTAAKK